MGFFNFGICLKSILNEVLSGYIDFSKSDLDKYSMSVTERGNDSQREKLIEYYGFEKVKNTMIQARYIHPLGITFVLPGSDIPLTELRFYKSSKETGGNFLDHNDDFE